MFSPSSTPKWRSILLLVLLAPPLYLFLLDFPELRQSDEALYGAFVQDLLRAPWNWGCAVYGQLVSGFPLYSWCVAVCSRFQMPTVWQLRLPAVLSLWGMAALSWLFVRRLRFRGRRHATLGNEADIEERHACAAWTAAAVVLTTVASFHVGTRAQSETLAAFWLSGAWYLWYLLGWQRKRWNLAWGLSFSLVLIAQLAIGAKALFVFYLPFFFLPKRFGMGRRLQAPSHILLLGGFAFITGIWLILVKGQPYMPWNAISGITIPEKSAGFFRHLFWMLPALFYYLFPWSFFVWGPFCLALQRLEDSFGQGQYLCTFLRTIVVSNLIVVWLLPGGSPLHLLPVLGPLAILIGIYLEILLRRYREFWKQMLRFFSRALAFLGTFSTLLWLANSLGLWSVENWAQKRTLQALAFSACSLLIGCYGLWRVKQPGEQVETQEKSTRAEQENRILGWLKSLYYEIWMPHGFGSFLLVLILGYRLLALALLLIPAGLKEGARSLCWEPVRKLNQEQQVIYLDLPDGANFKKMLVESFGMNSSLVMLKDPMTELPEILEKEGRVLVLSNRIPPVQGAEVKKISEDLLLERQMSFVYDVEKSGIKSSWKYTEVKKEGQPSERKISGFHFNVESQLPLLYWRREPRHQRGGARELDHLNLYSVVPQNDEASQEAGE